MLRAAEASKMRTVPGEAGTWVFIFGDLVVFGIFFLVFAVHRSGHVGDFLADQARLDRTLATINTILLLTSSVFVAVASGEMSRGRNRRAAGFVVLAGLLGAAFIVVKITEYSAKIAENITVVSSDFFMFYYMFTGIHLLHVVVGIGMLSWMWSRLKRGEMSDSVHAVVEGGAVFWHLVDVLWVVIFMLFYLVS